MAARRCEVTDVREVLRRLRLGEPARRIARELGLSRNTVAGYHRVGPKEIRSRTRNVRQSDTGHPSCHRVQCGAGRPIAGESCDCMAIRTARLGAML